MQTDLVNVLETDQNLKSVISKMLTERETLKAIKNVPEYSLRVLVLIHRLILDSREIPNRPLFSLAMPSDKFKKIISPSSLRVSIHQLTSNITFKTLRCMDDACLKVRSRLDDIPRLYIEVIELLPKSSDQDITQSSVAKIETLISMIKSAAYDCYLQMGYPKGDFNERLEELNELCQAEIAQRIEEAQVEVSTSFRIIHEIREKWAYLDDFSRHLRWKTDELGKTMNILEKYSKEDLLKEKIMPTILKSFNLCFEVMDLVEIYSHISTKYIALHVKRMERVLSETDSNLNINEIEDHRNIKKISLEIESLINQKQEEFKIRFQDRLKQIMNILN
ncbi:unnamed protein product, partial [Mesorhabditis belari]|uniref:Uncharacterized protein n=1 Tax=Mesorhabditis belari TaxID=2138241 RepID=A0AAF3EKD6_9BILA